MTVALLRIDGTGDIVTSRGSTTGFIGVGPSPTPIEVITGMVAGVNPPLDPMPPIPETGATAAVGDVAIGIEIRETRIVDGDDEVVAVTNRNVET